MKWMLFFLLGSCSFLTVQGQTEAVDPEDFYTQLTTQLANLGDRTTFPPRFSPDELNQRYNRNLLRDLGKFLQEFPERQITIIAHTDCQTNKAYNQALSKHRAYLVRKNLIDQGIDPSRLQALGAGHQFPLEACPCADCTEAQHQRNERVDIVWTTRTAMPETATIDTLPPEKLIPLNKSRVITLRTCIDAEGNVTEVEYVPTSSAKAKQALIDQAIEDAKSWKFGPSLSEEPCSLIKYTLAPEAQKN